ncbi:MAG: AAA family ATPase [Candidatus Liptonbacteria bacterium]
MPQLLKRLELTGFKSFADRVNLEFPAGITAIVGPNGSGKSNIIDAIRWLLGERDAKNLRGGKSEDLIFGGTAKRARFGQAQANLYFENIDNFFPVDFSEIVVSRRVNRSGDNQYFINNAEVRLKDLVDFFAQARLGARGLVVITQGNSDMFIRVSPKERREMIEEMLGLREYELKKAEAERRLKHARINLDKVRALTEEILPYLRSLKRQTSRWERRGSLEEELNGLEKDFFGIAYRELSASLRDSDKKIAEKQKEYPELERVRRAAEKHLADVEKTAPEEREELNTIKTRTRALLDARSRLQKEIGKLEAQLEIKDASDYKKHLPSHESLYSLVGKIREALDAFDWQDAGTAKAHIGRLIKDIDFVIETRSGEGEVSAPRDDIKKQFEAIEKQLTGLEQSMKELAERERVLEKSQEEFYVKFKEAVAALDRAKKQLEKWENERRDYGFEKERITLRIDEWKRQVEQASRRPEEFHNVMSVASSLSRGDMERRIFKLRGDLASIGEVDRALVKETEETEARYEYLNRESADLEKAGDDLKNLIAELKGKIKTEFDVALVRINKELQTFFELMFDGGHAELVLSEPKPKKQAEAENKESAAELGSESQIKDAVEGLEEEEVAEEGVEMHVKLPKKHITSLEMLSGGERSLVGIAALFALISVSPPPFLVLDEVDAPLDERNAKRFAEMLKQFSKETQFILVTHNRATMEAASILYGMTMDEDGVSNVVSLKLEEYAGRT